MVVDDDNNHVKAYGPGLDPSKCRSGVPTKFTIDASKSNQAPLSVNILSDQGPLTKKPDVKDNGDGTYDVTYVPPNEGANLKAHITYNGKDIPNSPFCLKVRPYSEPDKVKLSGPCVTEKVPASLPTVLKIDTNDAGFGDLEINVLVCILIKK